MQLFVLVASVWPDGTLSSWAYWGFAFSVERFCFPFAVLLHSPVIVVWFYSLTKKLRRAHESPYNLSNYTKAQCQTMKLQIGSTMLFVALPSHMYKVM